MKHDHSFAIGLGRAVREHPAQRLLYDAGQTISGLAEELEISRSRVNSWFASDKNLRAIPRRTALFLKSKYAIPLELWGKIADDI